MEGVLKGGIYKSPVGYDNVKWFVKEVEELEKNMTLYFKNTTKNIIVTEEDEEDYKKRLSILWKKNWIW